MTDLTNDPSGPRWLDVAGFICAILLPLAGFIIGIVVTLRERPGQANYGPAIIIASLIGTLFWLAVGA